MLKRDTSFLGHLAVVGQPQGVGNEVGELPAVCGQSPEDDWSSGGQAPYSWLT